MPFVLYHGNDIKLIRKKTSVFEKKMQNENPDLQIVIPENPSYESLMNQLSSGSLFGEKILYKIYDCEKIPKIETLLEKEIEDIVLMISYQETLPFRKNLKKLEKENFNLPKNYELEKYLINKFKNKISAEAVFYLSKSITSTLDIDEIEESMVLEKIDYLDLEAVYRVKGDSEAKIFLIIEDILNKKINQSVLSVNDYLADGGSAIPLTLLLLNQIQKYLAVKKALQEGTGETELASSLKMHPFLVKKMIQSSKGFSIQKLESLIMSIPKLELQMRKFDPVFIPYFIEKLILEISEEAG